VHGGARYRWTRHAVDLACNKPVIAAINGDAVGIGASMTLAADFRLCHEREIRFVFGRIGIVPEGLLQLVPAAPRRMNAHWMDTDAELGSRIPRLATRPLRVGPLRSGIVPPVQCPFPVDAFNADEARAWNQPGARLPARSRCDTKTKTRILAFVAAERKVCASVIEARYQLHRRDGCDHRLVATAKIEQRDAVHRLSRHTVHTNRRNVCATILSQRWFERFVEAKNVRRRERSMPTQERWPCGRSE